MPKALSKALDILSATARVAPDLLKTLAILLNILSDVYDNTSGPLNREGIADLPLLRTLLTIWQISRGPSFWEVMDVFVLVAYASLAALRTRFQQLLACLNFTLDSEAQATETMEMSEV